jgi:hypothetical protein
VGTLPCLMQVSLAGSTLPDTGTIDILLNGSTE